MVTWAHDVYDVHEASPLYKKTCQRISFIYVYLMFIIYIGEDGESPPSVKNLVIPPNLEYFPIRFPHQIFIPLFAVYLKSSLPPIKQRFQVITQ